MAENTISVSSERLVYDGQLGQLQAHSHAVLALLVGVEQPFILAAHGVTTSCSIAIVPASVEHELNFHGARVLVIYIEPHDLSYGSFHRALAGRCGTVNELGDTWQQAIAAWSARRDCQSLLSCSEAAFGVSTTTLDCRVRDLARCFNRGELLDADMSELGAHAQISPSRLVHLIKAELGVGVRRLKQHYRFKLVARAAADGQNLTSAAHAAGFADSGHFSRTFLETFGLSPSKVLLRSAGAEYRTP